MVARQSSEGRGFSKGAKGAGRGFPFYAEFLESRANAFRLRDATRDSYVRRLRVVFRDAAALGVAHPRDFTPKAVEQLEGTWAARMKPITVVEYLRHLKTFLNWCHSEGHIDTAPAFEVRPVSYVINTVTDEQFEEIVRACRDTANPLRDKALILLMGMAGLRVAEVCRLKVEDFQKGRLRLLGTKTDNDRWLPPPPSVCRAIDQYIRKERPRSYSPYLFLTQEGHALKVVGVQRLCTRLGAATGTDFSPHKLRHYFAVTGVRRGVPPFVLKDFLGHSTLAMTMKYVHLTGADLDRYKSAWD
jgi:integrase/recombinase XerD